MRSRPLLRRTVVLTALVALLIGVAAPVAASAKEYTAARKAGRALAALSCGFLEIPGNVVKTWRERGPAWGFTLGFVEGVGKTIPRHFVGLYELATAPFAMPKRYEPILEPEFPWGYFDE